MVECGAPVVLVICVTGRWDGDKVGVRGAGIGARVEAGSGKVGRAVTASVGLVVATGIGADVGGDIGAGVGGDVGAGFEMGGVKVGLGVAA